ncbi:c-type cytochrome [Azohydromonas aeria]|uniref:c-type cytochrome n=1 Tax=Azohydromonas aeria TaxID=2590212 RepID=UPI0012F86F3B|nr:c-type cytochrome [Azohydromonas aeria]
MNLTAASNRLLAAVLAAAGLALGLAPGAVAEAAAAPVPDTMAQRLQACTVCHGKEGRATNEGYFPRIAGKPAGYLYNQLVNFREARRHNATMNYLVEHLSDGYLREIAGHFAALDLPYPPPQTTNTPLALLAQGEALVRQGDARRGIPACMACHGRAMTGVEPAIPGLLGLPRDYLTGQLGAWQTGQRRAAAPDCMADIARRLSAQDVNAVAAWLSAQPLGGGGKPAREVALPLPLECGSGLQ